MLTRSVLLALFVCLTMGAFSAAAAPAQLIFVHGNAATGAPAQVDGMINWDNSQLTTPGKKIMVSHLGAKLRSKYGDIMKSYDSSKYALSSSECAACIQTSIGVVASFFQDDSVVPFVNYTPADKDWLLNFNANYPRNHLSSTGYYTFEHNDDYAQQVLASSDIEFLIDEFGPTCASQLMRCTLYAAEVLRARAAYRETTSQADAIWQKLIPLQQKNTQSQYGYVASAKPPTGSSGYLLATAIVDNAEAGEKLVHHYSGRYAIVLGLLNTLGAISGDGPVKNWTATFGTVVVIEKGSDGSLSFLSSTPGQTYNSMAYPDLTPLNVQCVGSDGKSYRSTSCPIDDVRRYIELSKPTVDQPYCYVEEDEKCLTVDAAPSTNCAYYRQHCPTTACSSQAVLDRGLDYTCVSFGSRGSLSHDSAAAVISVLIGLALGAGIGFLGTLLLNRTAKKEENRLLLNEADAE